MRTNPCSATCRHTKSEFGRFTNGLACDGCEDEVDSIRDGNRDRHV